MEEEVRNESGSNSDTEKSKMKAIARKNFANILRSQVENRSAITNLDVNDNSNEIPSQLIRIENSKITKVQQVQLPARPTSPIDTFDTVVTYNHNDVDDISEGLNNVKRDKTLKSIAINYNLALKAKEADSHVFVYEPMYVNSSALGSVTPEKYFSNEPMELMHAKPSDYLVNENTTVYKCYLCPYYHVKEMMIARHMIQNHLSQNIYRCHYCSAQFLTNYLAFLHVKKAHGKNIEVKIDFKPSDQISSQLSMTYKKHLYVPEEGVAQDEAEKSSGNKTGASISIKCHKCSLYCKSLSELQDHLKLIHFRYRPYSCSLCNYSKVSFATKLDLDHHMKTTHPDELWVRSSTSPLMTLSNNQQKKNEFNVNINWSQVWGGQTSLGEYKCQWCAYETDSNLHMLQHATSRHNWSKSIACPTCKSNHALKASHFVINRIECSCNTILHLEHETNKIKLGVENSYTCKLCMYTSYSKGNVMRHLKYNHTQCKPFSCGYCSYAAKEVSKIKTHILALHPDEPFKTIDKEHNNIEFKKLLEHLYETNIIVEKFKSEATPTVSSDYTINMGRNTVGDSFFECGTCYFTSRNIEDVYNHARTVHGQTLKPTVRERRNIVIPYGEHYKCIMCGYRCSDRSCMSRHAKYMHITSRPHSCPYCHYNNVEKTKVRLHVLSHHPNMPKLVKTNQRLLEQMSWEAKKFYVRVDGDGFEHAEGSMYDISNLKHKSSTPVDILSELPLGPIHSFDDPSCSQNDQPDSIDGEILTKEEPMEIEQIKIEKFDQLEADEALEYSLENRLHDTALKMQRLSNGLDAAERIKMSSESDDVNVSVEKLSDEILENFSEDENDVDVDDEVTSGDDEYDPSLDFSSESDEGVDDDYSCSSGELDVLEKQVEVIDLKKFVIQDEVLRDRKISEMFPLVKLIDVNDEFNIDPEDDDLNKILSKCC